MANPSRAWRAWRSPVAAVAAFALGQEGPPGERADERVAGEAAESPAPQAQTPIDPDLENPAPIDPAAEDHTLERLFFDQTDGAFDASGFLATRTGFLPVAVPITEPAVGLGLGLGLTFFHGKPKVIDGRGGDTPRVIMPSSTVLFGAATENGTWAAGVAHMGVWNDGRIRYNGSVGYAALHLKWYGQGGSLGGRSIDYENDMLLFDQRIRFQLGQSDFFLGPRYSFRGSNARLDTSPLPPGQDPGFDEGDLDSQTSGLGLTLSYDSLDQPFSPTRGFRGEATGAWFDDALGGDFDYGAASFTGIGYIPIEERVVLALRGDFAFNGDEAPFYQLSGLDVRGLERGRYVDDFAASLQSELRVDVSDRWTVLGFAGLGRVAGDFDDLIEATDQWAGGGGVRYLIAREYGLRMGVDVAYGDGDATVYITVGTGWIRP